MNEELQPRYRLQRDLAIAQAILLGDTVASVADRYGITLSGTRQLTLALLKQLGDERHTQYNFGIRRIRQDFPYWVVVLSDYEKTLGQAVESQARLLRATVTPQSGLGI